MITQPAAVGLLQEKLRTQHASLLLLWLTFETAMVNQKIGDWLMGKIFEHEIDKEFVNLIPMMLLKVTLPSFFGI